MKVLLWKRPPLVYGSGASAEQADWPMALARIRPGSGPFAEGPRENGTATRV